MQKYIVNIFRLLLAGSNNQIAPADANVSLMAPPGSKIIQVMHGKNNKKWGQQVVMDMSSSRKAGGEILVRLSGV